jgi:hypothetical protein
MKYSKSQIIKFAIRDSIEFQQILQSKLKTSLKEDKETLKISKDYVKQVKELLKEFSDV